MQLLPMESSPDGLISARDAVITKTPGWGVLTTTRNVNTREHKEHKRQKDYSEAEKEKTMKTWEQRRKRRPLGSVFGGQAPQKRSLAGPASCLLPTIVTQLAKKAGVGVRDRGGGGGEFRVRYERREHQEGRGHQTGGGDGRGKVQGTNAKEGGHVHPLCQ